MFLLALSCLMSLLATTTATSKDHIEGSVEYFKVGSKSSIRFEDKVDLKKLDPTELHRLSEIRCSYGSRINSFEAVYDTICKSHLKMMQQHGNLDQSKKHKRSSLVILPEDPIVHVKAWQCDGEDTRGHICAVEMYTAAGEAESLARQQVSRDHMIACGDKRGARYDKEQKDWPVTESWKARDGNEILFFTVVKGEEVESLSFDYGKPFTRAEC